VCPFYAMFLCIFNPSSDEHEKISSPIAIIYLLTDAYISFIIINMNEEKNLLSFADNVIFRVEKSVQAICGANDIGYCCGL
jgi:hypothetical protein